MLENSSFIDKYKASYSDFTRARSLSFKDLVVMQCNLMCSSISNELDTFFEILNSDDLDMSAPSASAFSTARRKIRHGVFGELDESLISSFYEYYDYKRWNGFRLIAVDGSPLQLPSSFATEVYFGRQQQEGAKSYVMGRIMSFYDVLNSFTLEAELAPYKAQERGLALKYIPNFGEKDLLLYDRNFYSYTVFQQHIANNAKFCMRLPIGSNMVKKFLESGEDERIVFYKADKKHKLECKEYNLPTEPIMLRLVRVELPDKNVEVLITNLFDTNVFPASCFKVLYNLRWPIEESYKTLKVKAQLPNWTGKSVESCKQDFYAKIFTLNLTALMIFEVDKDVQGKNKDKELDYKVCWSEAIRKMRKRIVKLFYTDNICRIIKYIKAKLVKNLTSIRPDRKVERKKYTRRAKFHMQYKNIS